MRSDPEHAQRVKDELIAAGMSGYGLKKFESLYLPNVIHPDEHIGAVVYGRYKAGEGLLGLSEGMLVATDSRIIFLDHKPGFTSIDEVNYEVVSGVQQTNVGPFSGISLHTRLGDYNIRFANNNVADRFCRFIETRRFEKVEFPSPQNKIDNSPKLSGTPATREILSEVATRFLEVHDVAVLSSIDRVGNLAGATVYYHLKDNKLYMLTKSETQKARNILAHNQSALTVYDPETAETVQMQGMIEVETDASLKQEIFNIIAKPRVYSGNITSPPVASLKEGAFVVLRFTPITAKYSDFKKV